MTRLVFFVAIIVIFVCFAGGWTLVLVSGYGGNRAGGSSLVSHVGGIMVYAAIILAPVCFLAGLIALVVEQVVHGSRGRSER